MNQITLNFNTCSPSPPRGYNVTWRVAGSSDSYTNAGNFFATPAIFYDTINPAGTMYEGFITSDLEGIDCDDIAWSTESGAAPEPYSIVLFIPNPCNGINSSYTIDGGTAGDIVTVRASFGGVMQKIINDFVRADLTISSPDGTTQANSSACYTDTFSHGFTLVCDTVITMTGATALVDLIAVVNNSSESITNVGVTIIDVNGVEKYITVIGCRGNSSTSGPC